ncbi:MAG TPA: helix-turn-helix domain-containing protein [Steroidobacteraceae bacterium]|jgi:AraC-like DNA-binding protein
MGSALRVLWISCSSNSFAAELLDECRRLCVVRTCAPTRALATLASTPCNAVVFDFQEPTAADLQLLQSVKRLHSGVPILMFTETHSEELAVWAFRARVWNYLVKPVPLRELKANLTQLEKLLARREPVGRQIERPGTMLPVPSAIGDPEKAIMERIIENIRRDHSNRLRIAHLARTCGMSRYAFSRLFHSTFGCSCRDYVMRLRIETACKLLGQSTWSVTEVAAAGGFTDASHFARVFRRYMRRSPAEFARLAPEDRAGRPERRASPRTASEPSAPVIAPTRARAQLLPAA